MKIDAVVQPHRRRHTLIVQLNHAPRNPAAIEAKGQHIDAGRRHDQPEPIHFFVWIDETSHMGKSDSAKDGEQGPQQGLTPISCAASYHKRTEACNQANQSSPCDG